VTLTLWRVLAVVGAIVLLSAGAGGVFAYQRWQESQDVRGSSTVEFETVEEPVVQPPRANVRWPTFGYEEQRRRTDDNAGLEPPFRAVWTYRAKSLVEFPPVLGYGNLFFQTNDGRLVALEARRGTVDWVYRTGRCAAATPAISDYTVYAVFLNRPPCNSEGDELDGELVALRTRDGTVRWRVTLGPSESSPLVVGDRVYVGDWRGRVRAYDTKTGRQVWSHETGGEIKGGVAHRDGVLYVGSYDHHVYALDAGTGRRLWRAGAQERIGTRGRFYSTPAVAYSRVYIGGTDGKVYSFGAASGKLRWSHGTGSYVYGSPAVWEQLVLIGSHDRRFYALDAATGDVVWRFDAAGRIAGSATVLDGVVYFSTLNQRTFALDARTGKELWRWNDGKYAGVIGGRQRMYLTGHTRLYAMLPRPPSK
jgi:outer membrane protein assembly factor BamB